MVAVNDAFLYLHPTPPMQHQARRDGTYAHACTEDVVHGAGQRLVRTSAQHRAGGLAGAGGGWRGLAGAGWGWLGQADAAGLLGCCVASTLLVVHD